MKRMISQSLAFMMLCVILNSCQKSGIQPAEGIERIESNEPVQKSSFLTSEKTRLAFATAFKDALLKVRAKNLANGVTAASEPYIIAPFFTQDNQGIFNFDWTTGKYESASFQTVINEDDYFIQFPDSTVAVKITSDNSTAIYEKGNFGTGSGFMLIGYEGQYEAFYRGPVVEFTYEDENGEIIVVKFIDFNSVQTRINIAGQGRVSEDGITGPWKVLQMMIKQKRGEPPVTGFVLK